MKSKIITNSIAIVLLTLTTALSLMAAPKNTITFYKVPLVCASAPAIGCGSKAKPVLQQLEKNNNVAEAWLNHTGTVIAVKWKPNINTTTGENTLQSLFKERDMKVELVSGKEYDAMLKDFAKKTNWHRQGEMDKLSQIEAGVIATRLVARVNAKTPLNNETVSSLENGFLEVFSNRFTNQNANKQTQADKLNNDLLAVGKKYLNEAKMNALQSAIGLGYRPVEGEVDKAKDKCCAKPKTTSKKSAAKQKESKGCCSKPSTI